MTNLKVCSPRPQAALGTAAYDRWLSPDHECLCEFHREASGFLLRFPGEADFLIDNALTTAVAWPVPDAQRGIERRLFENSIQPLLGNHAGGLFLHGSGVRTDFGAAVMLGNSRSGKTTLAGFLAKHGNPYMTEDVVDLAQSGDEFRLRSKASALRLFRDSAEHLLGETIEISVEGGKQPLKATEGLPFSSGSQRVSAIFLLGDDHGAEISVHRLRSAAALPALMPHAFILDVEDRPRLRGHFDRLADLADRVPVYTLDYPREYSALPQVRAAILEALEGMSADATE
ncbi:hypothetical protein FGU71_07090 [Erythrobacter insulae]|uniref:HprK-related kinase A n=1 Tax=Erythrobacter insulae TaxID=2584124 RepID=A0A547PBY5_9SPHN|nr:hypothetical protein [Erythrobacter insulae]TRD11653.1 hypothetical protein FGU71_07090 [Erythrobacter insulae]